MKKQLAFLLCIVLILLGVQFFYQYKTEKEVVTLIDSMTTSTDINSSLESLLTLKQHAFKSENNLSKLLVKKTSEKIEELLDQKGQFNFQRIAHAGGGFKNYYYTNSIDALEYNKYFFDLFEIDFSWTTDDYLVCQHYWTEDFKKNFQVNFEGPVSYGQFVELINKNNKFKNCTLGTLVDWLRLNPEKKIVTDIKDKNIEGLTVIAKNYPDVLKNFIPQIYNPNEYEAVKELGYDKVILTLYKYFDSKEKLLEEIKGQDYYAITVDTWKLENKWGNDLQATGKFIYTHTINSKPDFEKYKKLGADEIYTDFYRSQEVTQ